MINALVNLINYEPDIDKTYLYAKDLCKARYQFLIKKSEDIQTKHLNGSKTLIEYSNNMWDVFKNIEEYNPGMECKVLLVFDDMVADMHNNKTLNSLNLFIRRRKLKLSPVFITQSYFKVPKDVTLNTKHFFNENSKLMRTWTKYV